MLIIFIDQFVQQIDSIIWMIYVEDLFLDILCQEGQVISLCFCNFFEGYRYLLSMNMDLFLIYGY